MPKITYTEDFKRQAVYLVTNNGLSRNRVARDLGVSAGALREWLHRFAPQGSTVSDALLHNEQLRQLRRELARVQMERDILKKAVGIFSQMPPQT